MEFEFQWGEWAPRESLPRGLDEAAGDLRRIAWWNGRGWEYGGITSERVQYVVRVGPERSGRTLDGREHRWSEEGKGS